MPKFDQNAEQPTYELLNGDYPFQITAVEEKISKGAKTAGSPVRELTLDVYRDDSFTERVATVRDSLIDHQSCDWKFSVLAKCVRYPVGHGDAFDVDNCWRGYRGWGHFAPEQDKQDANKHWNRLKVYLTDRKHLPAVVVAEEESDDVPF